MVEVAQIAKEAPVLAEVAVGLLGIAILSGVVILSRVIMFYQRLKKENLTKPK